MLFKNIIDKENLNKSLRNKEGLFKKQNKKKNSKKQQVLSKTEKKEAVEKHNPPFTWRVKENLVCRKLSVKNKRERERETGETKEDKRREDDGKKRGE